MARNDFVVGISALLATHGLRKHEHVVGHLEGIEGSAAKIADDAPIEVDVHLESASGAVTAVGVVRAPIETTCVRCLQPVSTILEVKVRELYTTKEQDPNREQTYPISGAQIDLGDMAREALVLELPLVPLCREDCAGLCPQCGLDRNEVSCSCENVNLDPRWAGLEGLSRQLSESE